MFLLRSELGPYGADVAQPAGVEDDGDFFYAETSARRKWDVSVASLWGRRVEVGGEEGRVPYAGDVLRFREKEVDEDEVDDFEDDVDDVAVHWSVSGCTRAASRRS